MALIRIYRCSDCDQTAHTGLAMTVPLCPACRGPMKWVQTRDYHPELHGQLTGMRSAAIDFNQTAGRVVPIGDGIRVDSLHDMRRIERESEQQVRDGVPGAQLHIFRKYSQNDSNRDVNTLGPDPSQAPSKDWLTKHGHTLGSLRGDTAESSADLGPGMTEAGSSALPFDPRG